MVDDEYDLVAEQEKKQALELERQQEEFRKLLLTPGNRYWLWKLLAKTGIYRSGSWNDPHQMAIMSGQRDIGLWVLEQIMTNNPDAFALMQREAKEREDG